MTARTVGPRAFRRMANWNCYRRTGTSLKKVGRQRRGRAATRFGKQAALRPRPEPRGYSSLLFWRRIRRVICPPCKKTIQTEGTICPFCKTAIRGQSRGKRVVRTREIEKALTGERWRCRDGILRMYPCDKCGRWEEEAAKYRHSTEQHLRQILLESGVTDNPDEALKAARLILDRERPN